MRYVPAGDIGCYRGVGMTQMRPGINIIDGLSLYKKALTCSVFLRDECIQPISISIPFSGAKRFGCRSLYAGQPFPGRWWS